MKAATGHNGGKYFGFEFTFFAADSAPMNQLCACLRNVQAQTLPPMEIDLDAMMTTEQACAWLGLGPADLLEKSKGKRNATIPAFWLGKKTVRFHPRTIIAKLAADAGVSPEVIAASFRLRPIDRSEKQIPI